MKAPILLVAASWANAYTKGAHAFQRTFRATHTRIRRNLVTSASSSESSDSIIVDYRPVLSQLLKQFEERLGPLEEYPVPEEFKITHGSAGPTKVVTEVCAFSAGPLRHIRAALIAPEDPSIAGARVLNFVAFPHTWANLPVFGADLVTLPGGHLVLIDLHPMLPPSDHAQLVLPKVGPIHTQYQSSVDSEVEANDNVKNNNSTALNAGNSSQDKSLLPWGGALPEEAKPFFSPAALWTRLPNDAAGSARLQSEVCSDALPDYLGAFLDLCADAPASEPSAADDPQAAAQAIHAAARQRAYSEYRIEKDPARGMLTRMHGAEWADRLIAEVLFDYNLKYPEPSASPDDSAVKQIDAVSENSSLDDDESENQAVVDSNVLADAGPKDDDGDDSGSIGGAQAVDAASSDEAIATAERSIAELQQALKAAEAEAEAAAKAQEAAEAAASDAKASAAGAVATAESKAAVAEAAIQKLSSARALAKGGDN